MRTGEAWVHQSPPPQQHPPPLGWKSPVPYLFGGLAAMLGLIAFALLILACSYWKLSGYQDPAGGSASPGEAKPSHRGEKEMKEAVFANSVLVIMAGDEKPTFLATPATSRDDVSNGGRSSSDGVEDGKKVDTESANYIVVSSLILSPTSIYYMG